MSASCWISQACARSSSITTELRFGFLGYYARTTMGASPQTQDHSTGRLACLLVAVAGLLAALALAACGSDLGSGDSGSTSRGRGRLDHARSMASR